MRKISIFIAIFLISCNVSKSKIECNENQKFKKLFFSHIANIDQNITIFHGEKFIQSVIFISNYAPTSTNEIMNYSRTYPFGVYEKDRKKWIEWYEKNKCNNIQIKKKHIIPEAYIK